MRYQDVPSIDAPLRFLDRDHGFAGIDDSAGFFKVRAICRCGWKSETRHLTYAAAARAHKLHSP